MDNGLHLGREEKKEMENISFLFKKKITFEASGARLVTLPLILIRPPP